MIMKKAEDNPVLFARLKSVLNELSRKCDSKIQSWQVVKSVECVLSGHNK